MAIKKTTTYKRTIAFTRPDPDTVDAMIKDSYVATLEQISPQEMQAMREKDGGVIKDVHLVARALKAADDNTVEDILADAYAVGATARKIYETINAGVAGEGAVGKNSAT